ncbi:MAG: hypothetical protein LBC68_00880 [Prevotellaceae bacterium]|jgi:hypothetical protein|nr:hypothetical protein [Prevotellaceae bacterium]
MKKKIIIILLLLVIIDIIISEYLISVYYKSEPPHAMYLIMWYFISFIINLSVAGIMYFIRKYYVKLFISNIVVFIIIVTLVYNFEVEKYRKNQYEEWIYNINNIQHRISYSSHDIDNIYTITILKTYYNEDGVDRGIVHITNDTIYFLSVDSCQYYIYGDTLYNFEGINKIKVEKIY